MRDDRKSSPLLYFVLNGQVNSSMMRRLIDPQFGDGACLTN
jgi:hypothetical protein